MPVIFIKAIPVWTHETKNIYRCPVYHGTCAVPPTRLDL